MPQGARQRRRRLWLRTLLAGIGLLYVISIPWYRDSGDEVRIWLGLPDWVAVAVGCYVAVAVLNALAWGLVDLRDEAPADDRDVP